MAIAGALNAELMSNREQAGAAADYIATRLDALAEETEGGWIGEIRDGSDDFDVMLSRTVRGVKEVQIIDQAVIGSADARALDSFAAHLQSLYARPASLKRRDSETPVYGPRDLLKAIFEAGEKGISTQRYKGLGEMNADQLWETTLDPDARSLLQVRVQEATDADDLFTRLMGEEVEPRRAFIQDNALSVANLDY